MIRRFFALLALMSLTYLGSPALASAAYTPTIGVNCTVAANSAICAENTSGDKDPISGHSGIVLKAVNIISIIAGAAAVILIVVSGLRFVLSNGDSNAISGAKSTLVNALVGLIIIAASRSIIVFVLSKI